MQKDEVILNISTKEISKREDPTNQIKHEVLRFEQTSVLNKKTEKLPNVLALGGVHKYGILAPPKSSRTLNKRKGAKAKAKAKQSACTKDMVEP